MHVGDVDVGARAEDVVGVVAHEADVGHVEHGGAGGGDRAEQGRLGKISIFKSIVV